MTIFAYVAAIWLIVGGAAILWRKSFRFGAAALTILYGIFVIFPLPRFLTAPHYLGYRTAVYIGVVPSFASRSSCSSQQSSCGALWLHKARCHKEGHWRLSGPSGSARLLSALGT